MLTYLPPTLRLRRVLYQTGIADWSEGVVTEHDADSGLVTVLDTDDGSFWRDPESSLQVVARERPAQSFVFILRTGNLENLAGTARSVFVPMISSGNA